MSIITVAGVGIPRVPAAFQPARPTARLLRGLPPLLVLRAPRSMGKTSTIAWYLRRREFESHHVVWIDVHRPVTADQLWAWLSEALRNGGLVDLDGPAEMVIEEALRRLRRRLVVVIDGLHDIVDADADRRLVELVQSYELFHLVTISRTVRPIESLGPATVDTVTFGPRDLVLGPMEVRGLAAQLEVDLAESEAAALVEQYHGWPALLRAVLRAARRGPGGLLVHDDATVMGYASMLLDDLDPVGGRDLMTALAIPDRLEADDVEFLLAGNGESEPSHESPSEPVIAENGTPPYPGALREAVIQILRREDPDRYRELNARLSRRRLRQGRPMESITHAVRAELWHMALEVFEENWAHLLRHHGDELESAMRLLPEGIASGSARLRVMTEHAFDRDHRARAENALRAGLMFPGQDVPEYPLTTTRRLMAHRPDGTRPAPLVVVEGEPGHVVSDVLVEWGVAQLYDDDLIGAMYAFATACQEATLAGARAGAREAASAGALTMALLGHLEAAEAWADHASGIEAGVSDLEEIATPLIQILVAGQRLEGHVPLRPRRGNTCPAWLLPLLDLTRLAIAFRETLHGRLDRARVEILRLDARASEHETEIVRAWASALAVDIALSDGDLDRAASRLAHVSSRSAWLRAVHARRAFYAGGNSAAIQLTEDASHYAGARPRAGLELLLVRACAAHRLGRDDLAEESLSTAVGIAIDTGVLLPFLTVPRADLLAIAREGSWLRELLDHPVLRSTETVFPEPLGADALSEAELRVLRALATGDSLTRIARSLFIAESTVKTHVRRIYRKLGVRSRAAAISRARSCHLLE